MQPLTLNERRHAESVGEIRSSAVFRADCGDPSRLGREIDELLPIRKYNGDWKGVEFDRELLDCALRFTDLGAQWVIPRLGDRPEIDGEFSLIHLHDVLSQVEGGPVTIAEPTEFQLQFLSELRIIDHTPRSGSGKIAYVRIRRDVTPLEIWYSALADIGGDPFPPGYIKMEITYCQYLDALLLTKGAYGWQYLYADMSLRRGDFQEAVGYLRGMLELFPSLFPRHDYTGLRERLEERL